MPNVSNDAPRFMECKERSAIKWQGNSRRSRRIHCGNFCR